MMQSVIFHEKIPLILNSVRGSISVYECRNEASDTLRKSSSFNYFWYEIIYAIGDAFEIDKDSNLKIVLRRILLKISDEIVPPWVEDLRWLQRNWNNIFGTGYISQRGTFDTFLFDVGPRILTEIREKCDTEFATTIEEYLDVLNDLQ